MKKTPRKQKKRAIFLDRDGVINASPKNRFVTRWSEFQFLPGALEALKSLHDHQELCMVVSNQSGVGRKVMSQRTLTEINRRMVKAVGRHGGRIQAVFTCPHRPGEGCSCRKPRLGMIRRAVQRFSIDLRHSVVVGDSSRDIRMGRLAGCRTLLVLSGKLDQKGALALSVKPDRIVKDLSSAVRWILRKSRRR